jgi:hypothetical protein
LNNPLIGLGQTNQNIPVAFTGNNNIISQIPVDSNNCLVKPNNPFVAANPNIALNTNFNPILGETNYGFGNLEIINGNHYITYRSNNFNTNGVSRYHIEGGSNSIVFNP